MQAIRVAQTLEKRQSRRLLDKREARDLEAAKIVAGMDQVIPPTEERIVESIHNPTIIQSRAQGPDLRMKVLGDNTPLVQAIQAANEDDALYKKVKASPSEHPMFQIKDQMLWSRNRAGEDVLCLPRGLYQNKSIRGVILEQAHEIVGHFGPQKTCRLYPSVVLVAENDYGCYNIL
jgi:hypothetical protein